MNLCKGMVEWAERERQAGLSAGRIAGHSEGRKEGHEEGRIEGLAEGRLKSKIQIAHNAFSMGFDMEQVSILCDEDIEVTQEWFELWFKNTGNSGNL